MERFNRVSMAEDTQTVGAIGRTKSGVEQTVARRRDAERGRERERERERERRE